MATFTEEYIEKLRKRIRDKQYCRVIIEIQDGKPVSTQVTEKFKE